jgi:hypothetical protein
LWGMACAALHLPRRCPARRTYPSGVMFVDVVAWTVIVIGSSARPDAWPR